jgi:hypothetical protein
MEEDLTLNHLLPVSENGTNACHQYAHKTSEQ